MTYNVARMLSGILLSLPGGSAVKNLPAIQETQVQALGWEHLLEKEMANPLQFPLPGKSHGQGSLPGYSSWGCKRVRHNLVTTANAMLFYVAFIIT